jgi:hypothetical protein
VVSSYKDLPIHDLKSSSIDLKRPRKDYSRPVGNTSLDVLDSTKDSLLGHVFKFENNERCNARGEQLHRIGELGMEAQNVQH